MITTRDRVPAHTAAEINQHIQEEIEANQQYFRQNPKLTRQRLQELDKEWDIERAIEANAGAIGHSAFLHRPTLDHLAHACDRVSAPTRHAGWVSPGSGSKTAGFSDEP
jgi:hypothetical protein